MNTTQKAASNTNAGHQPDRVRSTAKFGTSGVVLLSKPGRLYRLTVTNHAATAYVLMVFDKATAPANSDIPIWRKLLPASGEADINLEEFGTYCALGIGIAISTAASPDTLTLAAAADAHFAALVK